MSWYRIIVPHDQNPAAEQAACRDSVASLYENEATYRSKEAPMGPMVHVEDLGKDGDIAIYFSPMAMTFAYGFAIGKGAVKCAPPTIMPLGNLYKVD